MPHLSPMQWSMMIISTWLLMSMISTMLFFPLKNKIMVMKSATKNYNDWHMYSSTNKL